MIRFYRIPNDPFSDEIEDKLNSLVVAHEVFIIPDDRTKQAKPFIEDGGGKIEGTSEIQKWIRTLEKELKWQRSLSGDGCFIYPDSGEVC